MDQDSGAEMVRVGYCTNCKLPIDYETDRVLINRPADTPTERLLFEMCLACWDGLIAAATLGRAV